jgi:FtsZ-binding cell division protein ZapB
MDSDPNLDHLNAEVKRLSGEVTLLRGRVSWYKEVNRRLENELSDVKAQMNQYKKELENITNDNTQ